MKSCHKCIVVFLVLVSACVGTASGKPVTGTADFLRWSVSEVDFPRAQLTGSAIGISNGMILVAGGAAEGEGSGVLDAIYAKGVSEGEWREVGQLPKRLTNGAVAAYQDGFWIVGGSDGEQISDGAYFLRWDAPSGQVVVEAKTTLPFGMAEVSAAKAGETLYVFGLHGEDRVLLQLDLSAAEEQRQWRELPIWPGEAKGIAAMAGQYGWLFLWSEDGSGWRYDPMQQRWMSIAACPFAGRRFAATAYGQSHIFAAGRDDAGRSVQSVYAYHTITDRWLLLKAWDIEGQSRAFLRDGEEVYVVFDRPEDLTVCRGEPSRYEAHFAWVDYAALGGYLLLMVGMGFYFSKRENTTDDFFLGGRRIPWWVAGISIRATQISSISYMTIPSKIFATNMAYFWALIGTPVACLVVIYYYLPFFRRLKVTTAYEYLEKRFNTAVRMFGSASFILFQLVRISIVMYLPAIALSAVTGINVFVCILAAGVLCTLYTVMGGIEAVVWTDLVQAIVLFGGALCIFVTALAGTQGGISGFFDINLHYDKFHSVDWTWDMTTTAIWVIVIGECFVKLVTYSSDQAVVQRYLTTRNEREAVKSMWMNIAFAVVWWVTIFTLGTVLFGFYQTRPELLDPRIKTDAIVPLYIAQHLPIGISGLVIASLFAATMSTVDSGMHSIATAFVTDFYRRMWPDREDRVYLNWARGVTIILGLFATVMAVLMAMANIRSIWDFFIGLLGLLSSGLGGLFALGIFTRRGNGIGGLAGLFASAFILYWVKTRTDVHLFCYAGIGFLSCAVIGYVVSLLIPVKQKDLAGLTIYDMGRREDD